METCVRGFSFMADGNVMDMQYIEGDELERTWKSTRRERVKQREQKIWDEFVKEQDILGAVCKDDPYQFLEELPESCLKELMETELQKMRKEAHDAKHEVEHGDGAGDGSPAREDSPHGCVVTFADDEKDCDMFHIFDDDNDKDDESGGEEEAINDSLCTVREGQKIDGNLSPDRLDKTSSKSSENVTNVIESSIYCAKLKDLRIKINEEILAMVCSLEGHDILPVPPEEVARMCKRSAEFSSRFNRIYMYQLQRQMHDVERNNKVTLPFAKHTQFQSQMVRIVSLHQNLLQSCQVFHKSFEQTACLCESAGALHALLAAARDATHASRAVPPPRDFAAATDLYNDELLLTCDKVDEIVNEHAIRSAEIMSNTGVTCVKTRRKTAKGRPKKKASGTWSKAGSKTDAEARLSMYSLDTLRVNQHPKSTSSKDNQSSGTSKMRLHLTSLASSKHAKAERTDGPPKSQRKSPRSRRPLMRDPAAGRPRPPRPARDTDIRTMVEAVETCTSSHISPEPSPAPSVKRSPRSPRSPCSPRSPRAPRSPTARNNTPRTAKSRDAASPKKSLQNTPRPNRIISPKSRLRHSPKSKNTLKIALSSIKSNTKETLDSSRVQITPVGKIQFVKRKDKNIIKKDTNDQKDNIEDKPDTNNTGSPQKEQAADVQRKERDDKKVDVKDKVEGKEKKEDHIIVNGENKSESSRIDSAVSAPSKVSHRSSDDASYETKVEKDWNKMSSMAPARCEVTRLLKQLCSGDGTGTRTERIVGVKNAQLLCISGGSPRQPSTPQLLRILEETIQKKVPKPLFQKAPSTPRDFQRYRMVFNIPEKTADNIFQYRTKFVQHMLTSPMYANSAVGKPWEMICSLSENIIDDILMSCAKELEIQEVIHELYKCETS